MTPIPDPVPLVAGLRAVVLVKGRAVVLVPLPDPVPNAVPLAAGLLAAVLAPNVTLLTGAVAGRVVPVLGTGFAEDDALLLSGFRLVAVGGAAVESLVAVLVVLVATGAVRGRPAADLFAPATDVELVVEVLTAEAANLGLAVATVAPVLVAELDLVAAAATAAATVATEATSAKATATSSSFLVSGTVSTNGSLLGTTASSISEIISSFGASDNNSSPAADRGSFIEADSSCSSGAACCSLIETNSSMVFSSEASSSFSATMSACSGSSSGDKNCFSSETKFPIAG